MTHRLFSIPYSNKVDPYNYLILINQYKHNIENIFLGLSELPNHLSLQTQENIFDSKQFLTITKGKYKRIVAYNPIFINEDINHIIKYFDNSIYPLIEKYHIDGFILTNLDLARHIHKDFHDIEIHTSCNAFQFTLRQMEQWRELAGVNLFNPPREAGRIPELLRTMHEYGYRIKLLVNEGCIFGCPYSYNHACEVASQINQLSVNNKLCGIYDIENIFKTNLILPKWLDYLDEYVDVYKIAGRNSSANKLRRMFDAYIHQIKFKYINDYMLCGNEHIIQKLANNNIMIEEDIIPDRLRYCESKDCHLTCFECSNALKKIKGLEKYESQFDKCMQ